MGKGRVALSKGNAALWEGRMDHMSKPRKQEAAEFEAAMRLARTAPPTMLGCPWFVYIYSNPGSSASVPCAVGTRRHVRQTAITTSHRSRRPKKTSRQQNPPNDDDDVSAQHDPENVLEHDPDTIPAAPSDPSTTTLPSSSSLAPPSPQPQRSIPRGTTKLLKKIHWHDPDATLCVICQGTVARADALSVGTDCAPHVHLYHAPCLARWWLHSLSRNCPRCTRLVSRFVVRARLPDQQVGWRVYRAVPGSHRRVVFEKFALVSQAWGLERALSARGTSCALEWLPMGREVEDEDGGNFVAAIVGWTARLWEGEEGELPRQGRRICKGLQWDEMRCMVRLYRAEVGR